jgi:dGTPase
MRESGLHFEHNEQSLRVVESLETMYPHCPGLNLTKEVLDGLLKHRTPFDRPKMEFAQSAHLEAQVVDLGDEIAYMSHDLDDGLRASMFGFHDVSRVILVARADERMRKKYGSEIPRSVVPVRLSSALMHLLVEDVLKETARNLEAHTVKTLADVRAYHGILVQFSTDVRAGLTELRDYLMKHYYFSERVNEQSTRGRRIIRDLFHFFIEHPEKLPENFQKFLDDGTQKETVVKDYIAGMTDGYAEKEAVKISGK